MQAHKPSTDDAVALAAQADLVLLTVEMLRPPSTTDRGEAQVWYESPASDLTSLVHMAFRERFPATEGSGSPTLFAALEEAQQLARQLDPESWSDEYARLFEGSQACSLNQASYIRRDKGAILGDLCGFYTAFGWRGNAHRGERPDHLLCQLEFVGILLAMAARAENEDQRRVVHDALADFARLHMHDWLPSACRHLVETTTLAYFGAVGQWLLLLWNHLTEYHDWPVDPVPGSPLPFDVEPDDPYECGAPDVVQLGGQSRIA